MPFLLPARSRHSTLQQLFVERIDAGGRRIHFLAVRTAIAGPRLFCKAALVSVMLMEVCCGAAQHIPKHHGAVFEVVDFGASSDGIRDSSPAIGKAVRAASTAGGGTIHFPCGEWRADAALNDAPAARSALYFDGLANITFRGEGNCSRVFTTVPARSVFEIRASSHVSFEKLRIEPAAALFHEQYQNDGGSAIRLSGVEGGFVREVEMSGGSSALLWMSAGTANYNVSKNYFHHAYGNSAIWEDDCSANDSTMDCGASSPPKGNVIEDNSFLENGAHGGTAQLVLDAGGHLTGTRVIGNTIRGRPEPNNPHIHGIQVRNAGGVLIERNRIVDVLDDGIAVTADDGITVSRTRILRNSVEGGCRDAAIILYASIEGRVERSDVRQNRIRSTEGRGIAIYGTVASHMTATQIAGNELTFTSESFMEGVPVDAFTLRGFGVELMNNQVTAASPSQQIWIRLDPDSSGVSGLGSTQRIGGGKVSIFDPITSLVRYPDDHFMSY